MHESNRVNQSEEVLGVSSHRFDPALLAVTDHFSAAAAEATGTGGERIRPVHVLVALTRVEGGLTAALLAEDRIPVDALREALRAGAPPARERPSRPPRLELEVDATAATRRVFDTLAREDTAAPVTEQRVLAAVLTELDEPDRALLVRHGRVDLDRWRERAERAAPRGRDPFGGGERPARSAFTPRAHAALKLMETEAAALGHTDYTSGLLLHALVTAPADLVEQALLFHAHDLDALRAQSLVLARGSGRGRAVPEGGSYDPRLREILRHSAELSALRGGTAVSERDLLAALVAMPEGVGAAFFRDTGVDPERLLAFADDYYTERAVAETEGVPTSPGRVDALLRGRLIGQSMVIDQLAPHVERILRSLSRGFLPEDRPGGAFLFCGASGTGKTLAARLLAEAVYGGPDEVLTFEMGQFNTAESINNLVGAPPGYVGFGQGKLTNGLRDGPRRVFLFDEVEKADARVMDALLRLLDEGRVNDPAGPLREAHETVVVVTSNLGAPEPRSATAAVPSTDADALLAEAFGEPHGAGSELRTALYGFFRPEFVNRFDEVLLFAPLGPTELHRIAGVELDRLAERVGRRLGVRLDWDGEAAAHIGSQAWRGHSDQGARGVRRCVEGVIPALLRLLDESDERGRAVNTVRLGVSQGMMTVTADG